MVVSSTYHHCYTIRWGVRCFSLTGASSRRSSFFSLRSGRDTAGGGSAADGPGALLPNRLPGPCSRRLGRGGARREMSRGDSDGGGLPLTEPDEAAAAPATAAAGAIVAAAAAEAMEAMEAAVGATEATEASAVATEAMGVATEAMGVEVTAAIHRWAASSTTCPRTGSPGPRPSSSEPIKTPQSKPCL